MILAMVEGIAMRALPQGQPSYAVDIDRKGKRLHLVLPCAADDARRLQQADLAMWTAVTRRDWSACLKQGAEMIAASAPRRRRH